MPSGQVSVWVPIVVALIGLLGLLLNQMIQARRENARLRSELEQEKIRQALGVRKEWRERRLEIYAEFVSASTSMASRLTGLKTSLVTNNGVAWPEQVKGVAEAQKTLDQLSNTIDLIGSADVRKKAGQVWAELLAVHVGLLMGDPPSGEKIDELVGLADAVHARIRGEVVRAFRADLGSDDHELPMRVSPAPSSAKAS